MLARVKLGVTDHWKANLTGQISSSGAKIYVQTKPRWSVAALRMVCSVLEEADIEISPDDSAPRIRESVKPPMPPTNGAP